MISYEDAVKRYERAQAPVRSAKWLAMPDKPRYLRNVSMTHYGIHRKEDGTIYYRCFNTNIATFYPRQADGSYKVECRFVNTPTTSAFIYRYGLSYHYLTTTNNDNVCVPYVQKGGWNTAEVTASLVFDESNRLIVDKSWHHDIYTMVSSPEDKEKRKHLRKSVGNLLALTEFMLPKYKLNADLRREYGEPFSTAHGNMPYEIQILERNIDQSLKMSSLGTYDFNNEVFIKDVMDAGQDVFNIVASTRAYHLNVLKYINTWNRSAEEIKQQEDEQRERCADVINGITFEDFKKAYVNRLLSAFKIKVGSQYKPWGQFRSTLPYKWVMKY